MGISSIVNSGWNYVKKGGRVYGELMFGTGADKLTSTVKKSVANRAANGQSYISALGTGVKDGFKQAHKSNLRHSALHGGFWGNIKYQLKTTPRLIKNGWKLGSNAAKAAGKSGLWGGIKGALGGIGKRMPLLGGILMLATEIPNIWNATKENGIWAGIKETVKSGTRVGAGMAGGAIGAALLAPIPVVGPLLGGILGYMAGDKLASLFTGKSHSEKKMEQEELLAQQQEQLQQQMQQAGYQGGSFDTGTTNPFATYQPTMTPQQLAQMQQMLYGGMGGLNDDFMYLTMKNQYNRPTA